MMLTARRLRGKTVLADAFFPLALLEWGQSENFLWTWQLMFMVPATIAGLVLLLVVAGTALFAWRWRCLRRGRAVACTDRRNWTRDGAGAGDLADVDGR